MDLPEILSLCRVSKRFNKDVCENKNFWISKLFKDYQIEYADIKTIFVDPKELYQLIISEPDELFNIISDVNIKQKNHIIGVAVENMYRIKHRIDYKYIPMGKQIYILYQTNYAYSEFNYYLTEEDIINNTLEIITNLMDDDIDHIFKDTTFEDFYGKSRQEYFGDLINQITQIKTKDTVVIKIPTQNMDEKLNDIYVLHKFVKK